MSRSILNRTLIMLLKIYKYTLSPAISLLGIRCRHYPTCSDYSIEMFATKSFHLALYRTVLRFLKCNPLFSGEIHNK